MIKSIEESEEEVQEPKENTNEDSWPTDCTTHALASHANPQAAKVEESFKQQPVTVLANNLMNSKGEQVTLCEKHGSEVMAISTQYLQKLAEISGASAKPNRLLPTKYKLFLKCHIQPNQLWLLKQRSQISGYFHGFSKERTILLKVFPDDDHQSTTHDHKKIESLQRQYRHGICDTKPYWMEIKILKEQEEGIHTSSIYKILTVTMPSTSMPTLPDRSNVLAIGADISVIGIDTTLMQDGQLLICTEALPTFYMMLLILRDTNCY
ncbi:hypothetical protein B296_00025501 [Ensete ventricosum]|uniref:Uncharacterized protein n=1 Tax=Ensete ventricosum TaxID=4639 RepID=A0A426YWE7_ENSVE|nr:hypothetical protein B296_00025501 [Ensete ventricosum]